MTTWTAEANASTTYTAATDATTVYVLADYVLSDYINDGGSWSVVAAASTNWS